MKNRGFTLIELMIVIAIIGIFAAIILPKNGLGTDRRHPNLLVFASNM